MILVRKLARVFSNKCIICEELVTRTGFEPMLKA